MKLEIAQPTPQSLLPLVQQRWFALTLAIGVMLFASVLFASTFRDLNLAGRLELVLVQMAGPITSFGELLNHRYCPWSFTVPVSSILALAAHPAFPNMGTLVVTLIGAFFWWSWGWFSLVSGI